MPTTILDIPTTKNPGQRSMGYEDAYLARFTPSWNRPPTFDGNAWRNVVNSQPFAVACRDTLISSILALDWKIIVRDNSMLDELAATVRYYTRLLEKAGYGSDLDYTSHVEWIAGDLLDLPFGAMSEIGRDGDKPNGRVRWIEPLDGATLFPTLNKDWPVIQYYNGNQVAFPSYAISRTYMKPRTRIEYKGWGICPPETVYLALDMLSRGDVYYANLLLDIPTTGILDLGDMEKESALEWVNAYKSLLANGGNSSFKIPVLYEHQNDIKFVPFGKVPNDIMFDRITQRYASLVTAAYGMTLSDIGIQSASNGGETLAGSIRSERKTRKSGFARLKKKLKFYFEQILPPTLAFHWVDYDDEVNVALGRARLATATSFKMLQEAGLITASEGRQQLIADGMFTISMASDPPEVPPTAVTSPTSRPDNQHMLGDPVPVSSGGHGEIKKHNINTEVVRSVAASLLGTYYQDLVDIRSEVGEDNLFEAKSIVENKVIPHMHDVSTNGWLKIDGISDAEVTTSEKVIEKFLLYELSQIVLSDNSTIDFSDSVVYDSVINTVSNKLLENLDDIVNISIETLGEANG